jgi:hypothetical protein
MLSFLTESSKSFEETATVGGFLASNDKNSFDGIFTEAYEEMLTAGVDVMSDLNALVKNKVKLERYKDLLLGELKKECAEMDENFGTHRLLYEQCSDMFDNCVEDFMKESATVGNLLPIKAVDIPILVKQQLKVATKDIMQTETTKSPVIKKHIEQTWIVDNKTKNRWRYPQCFFTEDFKEIYNAGKGLPIKNDVVNLPAFNYNIVENLTDGNPNTDTITMNLQITKVIAEGVEVVLDQPMRINLSDNTWLGGRINRTVKNEAGEDVVIDDLVTGTVDFLNNSVILNSVNGQVTGVIFNGYLSNERNERAITFDYSREEREWKIEDGARAEIPYSLEELEDAKALLDIDLYKKTWNNLADVMTQMEDSQVLDWLDEQFKLYDGVEVDPLQWSSFITKTTFDCDSTSLTTALPSEYIEKMFKFKIDRLIIDLADKAKLEDMTFVIYGNPRYISLLNPVVNWVTRPGSTHNGVKLDYGYGVMTSGDVKVQVVSTKKVNAKYDANTKLHEGIRIIPFPLSNEQFTFKHYKYTTHILTANNSAYRAADRPGGSYTYLMGTSRYTNAAIQGIQGQVGIANAEMYLTM